MVSLSSYTQYYSAITDFNNYNMFANNSPAAQRRPIQMFHVQTAPTFTQGTASATSSIRVTNSGTTGAVPLPAISNPNSYLKILGIDAQPGTWSEYTIWCDRLLDMGSISSSTTDVQTLNMSGHTRYSAGTGVYAFLSFTAAAATTEVIVTVNYVNQNGIGGRETKFRHGGGNLGGADFIRMVPLVSGDTGIRAIETLKFEVAPTSTLNTRFAYLCLFRPLFATVLNVLDKNQRYIPNFLNGNLVGGFQTLNGDECLFRLRMGAGGGDYAVYQGKNSGFFIIDEVQNI